MQEQEHTLARIREEKNELEKKFDQLRKAHKQAEQNNLILKNEQEKERAIAKEKKAHYEAKIREL